MNDNFIVNIVKSDIANGGNIITRFPPEPNGYLHIGHVKSICLNFELAAMFNGVCNLRFDDTNPEKETQDYIDSIERDIQWLGFDWGTTKYASDYFEQMFEFAIFFIEHGLAYVCDLTDQEVQEYRGDLTTYGRESPYKSRSITENLELFFQMRDGVFDDGTRTLRLNIDMASGNMNMRDPVIYRIMHAQHLRTGDTWCIYPMYDYAHPISDALEGITHSCCTLEFADHRPLYDWIVGYLFDHGKINCRPQQIEFARLEFPYTVTSKRKLLSLVEAKIVNGWNDPRMPTIAGLRERGFTQDGIKAFIAAVGVAKSPNYVSIDLFNSIMRDHLERVSFKMMAVISPLKVVITNFDEITVLGKQVPLHSHSGCGDRYLEITKEIYIEYDDFLEDRVDGWHRLCVNGEVRLRHGYIIQCNKVIYNDVGGIVALHCTVDVDTLGKNPVGRKVRGVIHWVNSYHVSIQVNLFENLFLVEHPDKMSGHFLDFINSQSKRTSVAYCENYIQNMSVGDRLQFERLGYFIVVDKQHMIECNRIITLKDKFHAQQMANT